AGEAALVGGDAGGNEGVTASVDGRAAAQEGHRLGRATVVAQRGQQRVGVDDAVGAKGDIDIVADQVVIAADGAAFVADVIFGTSGGIDGHDGVVQRHPPCVVEEAASVVGGGVAGQRAVGQRDNAGNVVVQAAALGKV